MTAPAALRPGGRVARGAPGIGAQHPLLLLDDLHRHYRVRTSSSPLAAKRTLHAVDGVSVHVVAGETFGIVGESGSGKSTLGRLALRLEEPTSGSVIFDGVDITHLRGERLRRLRPRMQVVFQDPLGSLNPRMTVGQIVGEPLRVFRGLRGTDLEAEVAMLLAAVGLDPSRAASRPRSLSGGQRQRVGIARAVALQPSLILADEAVSALDVSVQAQIVNLMVEMRERLGLTYLFIAHGLPIVRQIAHRVGVMYLGRMVEVGPTDEVFGNARHPYTQALMGAAPPAHPRARRSRTLLQGEPPSPLELPTGCRFRTRCPLAEDVCATEAPPRIAVRPDHVVECHFAERPAAAPALAAPVADARPGPSDQSRPTVLSNPPVV